MVKFMSWKEEKFDFFLEEKPKSLFAESIGNLKYPLTVSEDSS